MIVLLSAVSTFLLRDVYLVTTDNVPSYPKCILVFLVISPYLDVYNAVTSNSGSENNCVVRHGCSHTYNLSTEKAEAGGWQ